MIFRNSSGTNHRGKCSEKHFYAGTLLSTSDIFSYLFYNLLSYFVLIISSSLLYLTFKGHNISLSRRAPLLAFQYTV